MVIRVALEWLRSGQPSSLHDVSHYDRDADIAWLELAGFDASQVVVQEADWGLVETHSETGTVVAVEFWNASAALPSELLEALPSPGAQPTVIEAEQAGSEVSFGGSDGGLRSDG